MPGPTFNYRSAFIFTKTLWPALTSTSSKGRQIKAYFIGLTIQGKLSSPYNALFKYGSNTLTISRHSSVNNLHCNSLSLWTQHEAVIEHYGQSVAQHGHHRYRKSPKIDCLRFVMCPLLGPVLIGFFYFIFAPTINSTNEANKVGRTCH
jgi:hypothetical protein